MTTNSYVAQTVEFDMVPERYAKEVGIVVAEITLNMRKDWQHIIQMWFQSDIGADYKDLLCDAQHTELSFDRTGDESANSPAALNRGAKADQAVSAANANDIDKALVQSLLFTIMSVSGYYTGSGSDGTSNVALQIKNIFNAILSNMGGQSVEADESKIKEDLRRFETAGTNDTPSTTVDASATYSDGLYKTLTTDSDRDNALDANSTIISAINGLWASTDSTADSWHKTGRYVATATGTTATDTIDADLQFLLTNDVMRSATLGGLPKARAFLPVVNRLIKGGAFFVDTVQGEGHEYSATDLSDADKAAERKFNPSRQFRGATADKKREGDGTSTPMIDYDADLVFPVKIKIGETLTAAHASNADGDDVGADTAAAGSSATTSAIQFNLNIVIKPRALRA